MLNKIFKNISYFIRGFIAVFTIFIMVFYIGSYPVKAGSLPDISNILNEIQTVSTAASGAMTAVGAVASSAQAAGLPVATPGIGIGQGLQSFEALTADISKMEEIYQGIEINYAKLLHLVNAVNNAFGNINNLNNTLNNVFAGKILSNQDYTGGQGVNGITANGLTQSDLQGVSNINALINSLSSEINEIKSQFGPLLQDGNGNGSFSGIENIISGIAQDKDNLWGDSNNFVDSMVFDPAGNNGINAFGKGPNDNCLYNGGEFVQGCTDYVSSFINNMSAMNLDNAGISEARAHKAEFEGDEFENQIAGISGKSSNYYTYQSSVLSVIAEENAANLKNMGYIESQLKQLEMTDSANEIRKEHVGSSLLPPNDRNPQDNGIAFYSQTTL